VRLSRHALPAAGPNSQHIGYALQYRHSAHGSYKRFATNSSSSGGVSSSGGANGKVQQAGNSPREDPGGTDSNGPRIVEWGNISSDVHGFADSDFLMDNGSGEDSGDEAGRSNGSPRFGNWTDEAVAAAEASGQQNLENTGTITSPSASGDAPAPQPSPYTLEGGFKQISPHSLHARIQVFQADPEGNMMCVIDVRSENDYVAGHVPGALSVPFERLSETIRASGLENCKGIPIAIIGEAASMYPGVLGTTCAQANVRLRKVFGFTDVSSLQGGMVAWEQAGLPVDTGRT